MDNRTKPMVVLSYPRFASARVMSNPFPNARAGADAILLQAQTLKAQGAERAGKADSESDWGRSLVNELHGFNETVLQPLTRASELMGRADPNGFLTASLPGLFAVRELGEGSARGLETFRRHGYQPGSKGRLAGEVLLALTASPVWAMMAADKNSATHETLNKGADRIGAAEVALTDAVRRRLSSSGRAGLRGPQSGQAGPGRSGR